MDVFRSTIRECFAPEAASTAGRSALQRTRVTTFASGVASGAVFTTMVCMLFFLVWRPHRTGGSLPHSSSTAAPAADGRTPQAAGPSAAAAQATASANCSAPGCAWCPFGDLPGSWDLAAVPGGRWQLLGPRCQLQNLLPAYTRPLHGGLLNSSAAQEAGSAPDAAAAEVEAATFSDPDAGDAEAVGHTDVPLVDLAAAAAPPLPQGAPAARILFLSDSVDKHILTHLCTAAGGTVRAVLTRPGSREEGGGSAGTTVAHRALARNISSYVVHTCMSDSSVRLVAAYLPGVHPTGPYHRLVAQTYRQRIDRAVAVWKAHSPDAAPQVVVMSSLLWDVARMYAWEPWLVAGPQLAPPTLHSWAANFTRVVRYAMQALPEAGLFAFHTTLPPRHDVSSGRSEKPYLGRRVYIDQLNAAGRAAAAALGLEVIDYEQVGSRFREGQAYLSDLIHPGPLVGLEIANVLLNYAHQLQGGPRPGGGLREPPLSAEGAG